MKIYKNCIHHQAKGCWLCVQIGFTALLFKRWWRKPSHFDKPFRISLFAPSHTPQAGYKLDRFSFGRFESKQARQ